MTRTGGILPTPSMTIGGLLCFDLSGTVGFAYGHVGDLMPTFGSWHLSDSSLLGARYTSFENELIAAIERFRPRVIIMEAPLPSSAQGTTNVARQQFGLAAYVEGEAFRARIQVREVPASTVRKEVLGKGRFASGTAKAAVMAFCKGKGWNVSDDHQADALILWLYSCDVQRRLGRS